MRDKPEQPYWRDMKIQIIIIFLLFLKEIRHMRQKLTNVVFCKLGTGNVSLDAFIHMFVNQDGIRGISSH